MQIAGPAVAANNSMRRRGGASKLFVAPCALLMLDAAHAAPSGAVHETPICQVALSVSDGGRTRSWYQQLFGLEPIIGFWTAAASSPMGAKALGVRELVVTVSALRAQDPMSQFEVVQLDRPAPHALPADWNLRYVGYGIVGLVATDFDHVTRQLRATGPEPETTGAPGTRSIWIRDPDGVPLEIMEKDPLGLHRATPPDGEMASIRTITITVTDMQKAKRFWTTAMGLSPRPGKEFVFNAIPDNFNGGEEHWDEQVMQGGKFLVRLVRPRSAAVITRAAELRLSGVYHIATLLDDKAAWTAEVERVKNAGHPSYSTEGAMLLEHAGTTHGHDDDGNIVEIGFVEPGYERGAGWQR